MDVSSEMIHSLLPLYLTVGLGRERAGGRRDRGRGRGDGARREGVLGHALGRASATASGSRPRATASGRVSKPLFALATGPWLVFGARFVDRIGKGIRGAPRDALIADVTPPASRGAAYGLRQSLDTVGAFAGPLLAMALMLAWSNDFRAVFWVAVIPGALSFAPHRLRRARAAARPDGAGPKPCPFSWRAARGLGGAFWWVTAARRDAHARALQRGVPACCARRTSAWRSRWTPLVLVGMNVVFAAGRLPGGAARGPPRHARAARRPAPRRSWRPISCSPAPRASPALSAGVALWGVHMGLTQGLLAAMVAATAPPERSGHRLRRLQPGAAASRCWRRASWPARYGTTSGRRRRSSPGAVLAAAAIAVTRCAAR